MKIKDVCDVEELKIILNKMCYINDYGEWCFESNKDTEDLAQAISNLEVKLTLDGDRIYEIISEELNKGFLDDLSTADILRKQAQAIKSKAGGIIIKSL